MDKSVVKNNNEEVLKLVENFGFKFFGFDENESSLVVAPNGQIVPLNVAYEFVQQQIAKSQSGGGIEGMPNMPAMPQIPESSFETTLEKESSIEKAAEKKQEQANPQATQPVQNSNPTTPVVPSKEPESPYGDGFLPPVNPVFIDKAIEYVKKNSRKSLSSTSKWLSVQFEKFISEQDSPNKR